MSVKRWVIQRKTDGKYFSREGMQGNWTDDIHSAAMEWRSRDDTRTFCDEGEKPVPVLVTVERVKPKGGK
jgi:hypothetical protein